MQKKKVLNIGVIGAGRIGTVHAEHLTGRIENAKLVSIADSNFDAAQTLALRLNVDSTANYRDLLEDEKIDAVLICSSTDTHARIIEEAAQAGKHIFCEKPIDHELSKIDRALEAVKKAGVKLQVGFNRRFDPNFQQVKKVVSSGQIGATHILKITSRDPAPPPIDYIKVSGGIFFDMMIHDFDMARYLIGSDVVSVYASGAVRVDERIGEAGDVDTAVVVLEFADGTIGTIDNSRQAVYGYDQRVEVFGAEGCISAENQTEHRTTLSTRKSTELALPMHFFMTRYIQAYLNEINAFVDCVSNDTDSPVTGEDGRQPILIAMAAQRSLKERRKVGLAELELKV